MANDPSPQAIPTPTLEDIDADLKKGIALVPSQLGQETTEREFTAYTSNKMEGVTMEVENHPVLVVPLLTTIGVPDREFIVPGWDVDFAQQLIQDVHRATKGKPRPETEFRAGDMLVRVFPVPDTVLAEVASLWRSWFHARGYIVPTVWQIVFTDLEGHWPWQKECAPEVAQGQPILGEPDDEVRPLLAPNAPLA